MNASIENLGTALLGISIFVIPIVVTIAFLKKLDKPPKPKSKNAGCKNCKFYVAEDNDVYKLDRYKTEYSYYDSLESYRARVEFHANDRFHCGGYTSETYDHLTGKVTYITTDCKTHNADGKCSKFKDIHEEEKLVLSRWLKLQISIYWLLRKWCERL